MCIMCNVMWSLCMSPLFGTCVPFYGAIFDVLIRALQVNKKLAN